jgi:HAD superfamily hydrolase (TIGR01509 family)
MRDKPAGLSDVGAPAVLLDLDGTLIDSNYEHVMAWRLTFRRAAIEVPNAVLHRCIGLRDALLIQAVARAMKPARGFNVEKLATLHETYFRKSLRAPRPLPGAAALLKALSRHKVRWAIATGGDKKTVAQMIGSLSVPKSVPVITADDVAQAKPEPDVFLVAAKRLGTSMSNCIVVGDSVWDLLGARRAKALGVGLRCGGYGESELIAAGAYRVYADPADLLDHLAEIGIEAN